MFVFLSHLLGVGYQWAVKLTIVAVVLALWQVFVDPFTDDLQILMIWWLNQSVFVVISEEAMEFVEQAFVFAVTFKIFMILMASDGEQSTSNTWMYKPASNEH